MNSYIHGTRGFLNQIFINHRIGSFIESNKIEILTSLEDLQMRSLLLEMADIHHENSTSSNDSNKLTNNHSVKLRNEELALIENFIKIEHKIHVIIRVLQKEKFK